MAPGDDDAWSPAGMIDELAQSLGVTEPGSSLSRPVQGLDLLLNIPNAESDAEPDAESTAATSAEPGRMLLPLRLAAGRARRPAGARGRTARVAREPTGVPGVRPAGDAGYQATFRDKYLGSFATIEAAKAAYEAAVAAGEGGEREDRYSTGKRKDRSGDRQRMAAITTLQEQEERARDEAVADSFLGDDTLPPTATDQVAAASADYPTHSSDGIKLHLSNQAKSGYRGVFQRPRDHRCKRQTLGQWIAKIGGDGPDGYRASFDTKLDAARAVAIHLLHPGIPVVSPGANEGVQQSAGDMAVRIQSAGDMAARIQCAGARAALQPSCATAVTTAPVCITNSTATGGSANSAGGGHAGASGDAVASDAIRVAAVSDHSILDMWRRLLRATNRAATAAARDKQVSERPDEEQATAEEQATTDLPDEAPLQVSERPDEAQAPADFAWPSGAACEFAYNRTWYRAVSAGLQLDAHTGQRVLHLHEVRSTSITMVDVDDIADSIAPRGHHLIWISRDDARTVALQRRISPMQPPSAPPSPPSSTPCRRSDACHRLAPPSPPFSLRVMLLVLLALFVRSVCGVRAASALPPSSLSLRVIRHSSVSTTPFQLRTGSRLSGWEGEIRISCGSSSIREPPQLPRGCAVLLTSCALLLLLLLTWGHLRNSRTPRARNTVRVCPVCTSWYLACGPCRAYLRWSQLTRRSKMHSSQ